jgi:hypothetical protein
MADLLLAGCKRPPSRKAAKRILEESYPFFLFAAWRLGGSPFFGRSSRHGDRSAAV